MDFYFTDRKFNLLGVASTSGSTDISLANEEDKLSIEDSVRTLAGSLFYGPDSRAKAESMSALGNYVLYKDESGRSVWTTIMEINNDPLAGECVFLAEDAGVDLINELVGPYTADKAYPIASYISRFTADSGFKIGVNEISNLSRKLEWESEESTALARILSVATQFDNAELEFRFEVNGLQVVERYIDIFKKRGKDERVTLYVDKDINRITTSGNLYELGTSLYGIGGTPEGKDNPITLKGYKYTDKEGRYVLGSDGIMRDTVAVQKWSRLLSNDNPVPKSSHIQRRKTYETTDQKTLCDDVLRDLKKMAEVELNYEAEIVSLPYGVKIGDTIYLVDDQGELYLSARVLELVRCYSEDRYLATLGNYLIKDSGVDVNLQEIADKLKDQIKPGDTYYPWTRYADDANGTGMSSVPDGKTYMATVYRKNDPIASDNPEDYAGQWVKVKGDDGIGEKGDPGTSPIITPNDDGTITIVDDEGTKTTPDLKGPQGDEGVGIDSENTKTDYQLHTSATTPPTGTWVASPPAVTVGKYLWTRTILEYTDGTKSTPAYSVSGGPGKDGETGEQGPPTGIVSQSTVPSSPYVGMLWDNTGEIAGYQINTTYRWDGTEWKVHLFSADNIRADTFTGFVFRGVEFIGSKFVSEFRYPIGDGPYYYADGTTTIDNGSVVTDLIEHYPTDPEEYDESFSRHVELSPQNALYMKLQGLRSDLSQEIQLSPGGLMLKTNELMATLTVENIYSLVRPAGRSVKPADDANRKSVSLSYSRVGNIVSVGINFELLSDTGWVTLAPVAPSGYRPASAYQATGMACSLSYRGYTCAVYYNSSGFRLIPSIGQGKGSFQLGLTWKTNDPFPYGDS